VVDDKSYPSLLTDEISSRLSNGHKNVSPKLTSTVNNNPNNTETKTSENGDVFVAVNEQNNGVPTNGYHQDGPINHNLSQSTEIFYCCSKKLIVSCTSIIQAIL